MVIDIKGVLLAIFVFVLQLVANLVITHKIKKRLEDSDKKQTEKEKAKVEYESVVFDMTNATAKLSYALAMAIKRGSPNGEVEAGIAAYNEAMDKKDKFLQRQTIYKIAS